ncbi:MAG: helix-turn-helix transcriptional regulator [Solirubrobacterales bacterium]
MPKPQLVVGANIRRYRKAQGLTQEALAERCGVHPVELARAERGVRDMRVSTVTKIATGLGIPAGELLAGLGGKGKRRP